MINRSCWDSFLTVLYYSRRESRGSNVIVNERTIQNRKSIEKAKANGRTQVRVTLPDADTSKDYATLTNGVNAKQLGTVLSVLIKLGTEAMESGRLVIKNGEVMLSD